MQFNLLKIACLCVILCSSYCIRITAQTRTVHTETRLRSKQVAVNSFEWAFDNTTGIAAATISVTNHSKRAIKSITALFTGQAKGGVMLQSNGVRTIRRKSVAEHIAADETKTIVIEKAFNNMQLETLKLMQLDVVFENNAVETAN